MGFKSKLLSALKNFGGCMGTPKADKNEPMKNSGLCDLPKDQEELEVAKDSVHSKNDGVNEERNIDGTQVALDVIVDDEVEEKEIEESAIQEKPFEDEDDDEQQVKNNSEEKPKSRSED